MRLYTVLGHFMGLKVGIQAPHRATESSWSAAVSCRLWGWGGLRIGFTQDSTTKQCKPHCAAFPVSYARVSAVLPVSTAY